MNIGDLRHRVTIQAATATRDGYGGEVATWATVATVWAAIEPLQGREFLEGKRQETGLNTRIRIRYRAGIRPAMRVVWGDHIYDIQDVIEPQSRRRALELMCTETGLDR